MVRSVRLIMLLDNMCLLTWRDLVTGSSSGFGRRMTEVALEKGDNVVATLRTPSALSDLAATYGPDRLRVVQLDVAQSSQIADAFTQAKAAFGRIDVVFNNAGLAAVGEVESTPEEAARRVLDVTFWGAANVNKEAVRFFREDNPPGVGGRLLINSSAGGIRAGTCVPYYNAAKFGESFTSHQRQ